MFAEDTLWCEKSSTQEGGNEPTEKRPDHRDQGVQGA